MRAMMFEKLAASVWFQTRLLLYPQSITTMFGNDRLSPPLAQDGLLQECVQKEMDKKKYRANRKVADGEQVKQVQYSMAVLHYTAPAYKPQVRYLDSRS